MFTERHVPAFRTPELVAEHAVQLHHLAVVRAVGRIATQVKAVTGRGWINNHFFHGCPLSSNLAMSTRVCKMRHNNTMIEKPTKAKTDPTTIQNPV